MEETKRKELINEYVSKSIQFTLGMMDDTAQRINNEQSVKLSDARAAQIRTEELVKHLEQSSSLATSYAKKADLLGMDGDIFNQNNLDKAAFEQQQLADYLKGRLADEKAFVDINYKPMAYNSSVGFKLLTKQCCC